ncbi:MAG TPA: DUF3333 domain-containing protein, partial [Paracoccaceae bacterium]|nr:DUF3333 domain-containing protein [Paracoccaceae bacterium]
MTDVPMTPPSTAPIARLGGNVAARHRSEMLLKGAGLAAISIAFLMLAIMLWSLISTGYKAFIQTHITLELQVPADIDPANIAGANWRSVMQDIVRSEFPEATTQELRSFTGILTN